MPSRRIVHVAALALALLLAGCTTSEPDTRGADVDGDGLPDVDETNGWGVVAERETGSVAYEVTSDPAAVDTDGDGVGDADEYRTLTDPRNVDTDADGLLDGRSVCNPGMDAPDFVSLGIVRDPSNPACFLGEKSVCEGDRGLDPLHWDTDDDGLSDGVETRGWRITVRDEERSVASSPCNADTDRDGLLDGEERARGTDPTSQDTDRDGALDSVDADPLWDLGFTVTLQDLTVTADAPENATLRFILNAHGTTRTFERAPGAGFSENVTLSADVDDTTADPSSLNGTVLYRVLFVQDGDRGTDVDVGGASWNGSQVRIDYDLVSERAFVKGAHAPREGSVVTTEGADGAVTLRFTVTRE